jgi:hypothetical protein
MEPNSPQKEPLLETPSQNLKDTDSSEISIKDCVKKLSVNKQINLLIIKNLRIFQRNLSFFGYHCLIFLLVFLWMILISYLIKNQSSLVQVATYKPTELVTYNKCGDSTMDQDNCLTLGVVLVDENKLNPSTEEWIERALYDLEMKYGLKEGQDMKVIYRGNQMEDLYDQMSQFSEIKSMISFCNQYNFFSNSTMTLSCDSANVSGMNVDLNLYGVHYNSTKLMPNYLRDTGTPIASDKNAILLKMAVDESIINFYREQPNSHNMFSLPYNPVSRCSRTFPNVKKMVKNSALLSPEQILSEMETAEESDMVGSGKFSYDLKMMDYPKPKNRFIEKFDSSNQWGSFYYMFIILLSFVKFAQYIAKEKQNQLRKGLIPLGLNHFAYWFSWLICIGIFDIIFTSCMVFGGMILGFPLFREVVFIMPFLVILFCLWSYRFLAVLVITCCDNYRSATKANYTILVVSIFLQSKVQFEVYIKVLLHGLNQKSYLVKEAKKLKNLKNLNSILY